MKCEKCGGLVMNRTGGAACLNCGWRPGEPVRRFYAPDRGPIQLTKRGLLRQRVREDALQGGE